MKSYNEIKSNKRKKSDTNEWVVEIDDNGKDIIIGDENGPYKFSTKEEAFSALQGWYGSVPVVDFAIKNLKTGESYKSEDFPEIESLI